MGHDEAMPLVRHFMPFKARNTKVKSRFYECERLGRSEATQGTVCSGPYMHLMNKELDNPASVSNILHSSDIEVKLLLGQEPASLLRLNQHSPQYPISPSLYLLEPVCTSGFAILAPFWSTTSCSTALHAQLTTTSLPHDGFYHRQLGDLLCNMPQDSK